MHSCGCANPCSQPVCQLQAGTRLVVGGLLLELGALYLLTGRLLCGRGAQPGAGRQADLPIMATWTRPTPARLPIMVQAYETLSPLKCDKDSHRMLLHRM